MKTTICNNCNKSFEIYPVIDGKRRDCRGRSICLICKPLEQQIHSPKICLNCNNEFKRHVIINGKKYNLNNRKYCLNCSPFKEHNTKQKHIVKIAKENHTCPNCNTTYPYNEKYFYKRKNRINVELFSYCRKCDIKRTVANRVKIKRLLVEHFGGKCIICKFDKSQVSLCFHHIDPSKKEFNVNRIHNLADCIKEAKKCILICRNCHNEIHSGLYPQYLLSKTARDKRSTHNKQLSQRQEAKRDVINDMGGKCAQCGYMKCLASLNFHHLNTHEKEFTIGATFITKEKMMLEAKKCIILCDNCHQIEHYG